MELRLKINRLLASQTGTLKAAEFIRLHAIIIVFCVLQIIQYKDQLDISR